jgi:hypothetical protein
MKTIPDLLREADPLGHESGLSNEERARIRRAALTGARADRPPARRVRPAAAALALVAAIGALVIGSSLASLFWSRDGGTLQAAVRFEVRLAESHPRPGLREARVADSNRLVYLYDDVVVTNPDIRQATVADENGRFRVDVRFTDGGALLMRQATERHLGRPVAILIDGQVVMAPIVTSPIGASATISGGFTRREAERIASGIGLR